MSEQNKFDSTYSVLEAIYDKLKSGDICPEFTTESLTERISENGTYNYTPTTDGYSSVDISVDVHPELEYLWETITENGPYLYTPDRDGYSQVNIDVDVRPRLKSLNEMIWENGVYEYIPQSGYDGYSSVDINVDVQPELEPLTETITENGTYNYTPNMDGYRSVDIIVDVPAGGGGGPSDVLKEEFESIGYTDEVIDIIVSDISKDIEYTKTLVDKWDPSKTSASGLYFMNTELVYAPNIDTSNVTDMRNMFLECGSLKAISLLDTSNVTDMYGMFSYCWSLPAIPQLDTSNVTNMYGMFMYCESLTEIPQLDTSNVTNMWNMFSGCSALTTIPQLDTSNVTDMQSMFSGCGSLTTIPLLDVSNVTNMEGMFLGCDSLTTLGGFKNLKLDLDLSSLTNLTHDSLMNVINNLYDLKSDGLDNKTLTLGDKNFEKLEKDEVTIAYDKGWDVI